MNFFAFMIRTFALMKNQFNSVYSLKFRFHDTKFRIFFLVCQFTRNITILNVTFGNIFNLTILFAPSSFER